jgi:hypothetical protein
VAMHLAYLGAGYHVRYLNIIVQLLTYS